MTFCTPLNRRQFLSRSAALAGVSVAVMPSRRISAAQDSSVDIGSEPQLLIDDWIVERSAGLKRTLHQPKKQGLIQEADGGDWQRGDVRHIVRDREGRLHMTYRYTWWDPTVRDLHANIGEDRAHWFRQSVGYATSEDGRRWHKPKLGLLDGPTGFRRIDRFPFEEPLGFSKQNNLGCPIDSAFDIAEIGGVPTQQQRLLVRYSFRDGTHAFSRATEERQCYAHDWPDFVNDRHWKEKLTPIPEFSGPSRGSLVGYDQRASLWFALGQDVIPRWVSRGGRDIIRCTSADLTHWSEPQLVLPVAEDESREPGDWVEYMEMAATRRGGPQTGAWLGQLVIFHGDRSDPEYQMPTIPNVWRKGLTELRLLLSRDAGATWQRVGDKQPWLPYHNEEHGFDRMVYIGCFMPMQDQVHFYYPAWDGDHLTFRRNGEPYYSDRMRIGRTALATLRRDGYVSLDAANDSGRIVTKPLKFDGRQLTVNLSAPNGTLRVELQDAAGRPIEGLTAADCQPVTGDGVELAVRWRGDRDLAPLAGKPMRVQFELHNASLYAFQFA